MQNSSSVSPNSSASELDLKLYARLLWHWAWLILLCSVLAGVAAYIISLNSPAIYQATTMVLVSEGRSSSTTNMQDLMLSERIGRTYAELMMRDTMIVQIAEQFQIDPAILEDALTDIKITTIANTQLMKIVVEGTAPELVVATADTLPKVFGTEIKRVQGERFADAKTNLQSRLQELTNKIEQLQVEMDKLENASSEGANAELTRLSNQRSQLQSTHNSLNQSLETINLTEAQSNDSLSIVEPPMVPEEPIRPRILINSLLAAIVGAMLALGIIFLMEYLDDRIKSPQDLYQIVDTSLLGTIPLIPDTEKNKKQRGKAVASSPPGSMDTSLITTLQPRHPISEAYRALRTNLQFASVDTILDSVLITSATPGEGKTTTAANLAIVLAQAGRSVILVDADLRKPRQHKIFNVPQTPGLSEAIWLNEDGPIRLLHATKIPNLRLLSSGKIPPNPAELLGSQRMHELIQRLQAHADIVIFDAPPILAVTDAQVLAHQTRGILLVVDSSRTPRGTLVNAIEALARANANLFGVVFNRLVKSNRGYYYYQYEGYGEYYSDQEEVDETPSPEEVVPQKVMTAKKNETLVASMLKETIAETTHVHHQNGNGVYLAKSKTEKS